MIIQTLQNLQGLVVVNTVSDNHTSAETYELSIIFKYIIWKVSYYNKQSCSEKPRRLKEQVTQVTSNFSYFSVLNVVRNQL